IYSAARGFVCWGTWEDVVVISPPPNVIKSESSVVGVIAENLLNGSDAIAVAILYKSLSNCPFPPIG
ncbi:MAG: hypothetical protein PHS86_12095, partial [Syntrophaceae bacterium]|nr:hypothetical protein [Syntrophaceae bacterium]